MTESAACRFYHTNKMNRVNSNSVFFTFCIFIILNYTNESRKKEKKFVCEVEQKKVVCELKVLGFATIGLFLHENTLEINYNSWLIGSVYISSLTDY